MQKLNTFILKAHSSNCLHVAEKVLQWIVIITVDCHFKARYYTSYTL